MSRPEWNVKQTVAAEFFDVSLPTIGAWIRRGCPVADRLESGRVAAVSLSQMAQWRIRQAQNRDRDPVAERARRDAEAADKLALDNAKTRGELLSLDETRNAWVGTMTECKVRLLGLPAKLAPQVIGSSREEARAIIEAAIHDALSSLADAGAGLLGSAETTASSDGERVGRPAPPAVERGERGAGAVVDG